jgi:hypothetical protein
LRGRGPDFGDLRRIELETGGGQEANVERLPHREDERFAARIEQPARLFDRMLGQI